MMSYKAMVDTAREKGLGSEKIMLESLDDVDDILCILKETQPEKYWKFMRKQHAHLYGGHYDEEFARHDVAHLEYTDRNGQDRKGEHWTVDQVEEATKSMTFPQGVNRWDKYVAMNSWYADLNHELSDEQILKTGRLFWFYDKDWKTGQKLWWYNCR